MVVRRTILRVATKPFRVALGLIKNIAVTLILITAAMYVSNDYVRSATNNYVQSKFKKSDSPRRIRRKPLQKSRRSQFK